MIKKVPHRDRIVVLYTALVFLPASKKPFVDIQHALDLTAGEKSQPYAFTVRPVRYRIKENTFIQNT